jgi:hypothetical protein
MADYLGTTQRLHDYFAKNWTRPNLPYAECAGIWLKVLSTIFCYPNDHPFQIKPEFRPHQSSRQYFAATTSHSSAKPVWVLSDNEAVIAVVEVRPLTESVHWGSVQGSAYDYIAKLNKHSKPTIGIIAQGDKFICWEQIPLGSDKGYECTLPRKLFPARGMPVSVVKDSVAVQTQFQGVRERAMNGDFTDY